ncbi:MAG: hypothetical protein ACR2OZ_01020 [Verrucomicrobiales bacterium]
MFARNRFLVSIGPRMSAVWSYLLGIDTPRSKRWLRLHAVLLSVVALAALILFWHFAMFTAHVMNNDPQHPKKNHDQTIYLEHASFLKHRGASYIVPRQHMPGYGALLVPFMRHGEGIWQFFWRSKTLAVVLSVLALAGLAAVWRLVFPWTETVLFSAAAGFLLYVFRAGYFQPELIFCGLFLLCLVLVLKMLVKPGWMLAIAAGAAFVATHMFKSSTLPALALFLFASAVRIVPLVSRSEWPQVLRQGAMALTVPLVFCALLSPYLRTSKKLFGSYFFSAHTRYHMWVDTHDESRALVGMRLGAQAPTFDDAVLSQAKDYDQARPFFEKWQRSGLPGPSRYFAEHSWQNIGERFLDSADRQFDRIKRDYRGLVRFLQGLFGAALAVLVINFSEARRLFARFWLPICTYAAVMAGYFVAYAFYAKIGMGPRLFLTLAMPLVFGLAMMVWALGREMRIPFTSFDLSFRKLANWALVAVLANSAFRGLTDHIYWVPGGQ